MTTHKPYENAQGKFTASIDDIPNFKSDKIYLNEDKWLTIVSVDEVSDSPLRIIEISLATDIPNGKHSYPGEQVRSLEVGASSASEYYLTISGSVNINFDREKNHYKGQIKITAWELFTSKTILVVADFNLHKNTIPVHKHTE